ncbi:Signal transducer and transcription activator [Trichoplax sp. H2]|nr:Signal transducer and transcription activator [Trichoplax sp. H2]|eukprot:RDD41582.1 Signal transducer and transcription activator [Trichoplax sp. H2]
MVSYSTISFEFNMASWIDHFPQLYHVLCNIRPFFNQIFQDNEMLTLPCSDQILKWDKSFSYKYEDEFSDASQETKIGDNKAFFCDIAFHLIHNQFNLLKEKQCPNVIVHNQYITEMINRFRVTCSVCAIEYLKPLANLFSNSSSMNELHKNYKTPNYAILINRSKSELNLFQFPITTYKDVAIPSENNYQIAHVHIDGLCSHFALSMLIMYILSMELQWRTLSVSLLTEDDIASPDDIDPPPYDDIIYSKYGQETAADLQQGKNKSNKDEVSKRKSKIRDIEKFIRYYLDDALNYLDKAQNVVLDMIAKLKYEGRERSLNSNSSDEELQTKLYYISNRIDQLFHLQDKLGIFIRDEKRKLSESYKDISEEPSQLLNQLKKSEETLFNLQLSLLERSIVVINVSKPCIQKGTPFSCKLCILGINKIISQDFKIEMKLTGGKSKLEIDGLGIISSEESRYLSIVYKDILIPDFSDFVCRESSTDDRFFFNWKMPKIAVVTLDKNIHTTLQVTSPSIRVINRKKDTIAAECSLVWDYYISPWDKEMHQVDFPQRAKWCQIKNMLNRFCFCRLKQNLTDQNLRYIYKRMTGADIENPAHPISWNQYYKEKLRDIQQSITFGGWFFTCIELLNEPKHNLLKWWKNGLMIGFISKIAADELLQYYPPGTFIIRFSEQKLGRISISYVNENRKVCRIYPMKCHIEVELKHSLTDTDIHGIVQKERRIITWIDWILKSGKSKLKYFYPVLQTIDILKDTLNPGKTSHEVEIRYINYGIYTISDSNAVATRKNDRKCPRNAILWKKYEL